MPTYLRIGMACLGLLASSCSSPPPRPVSLPAPPPVWRICAADEDPAVTGCRKEKPAASITIRGHHDQ
jgi:hypothetical protein